MARKTSASKIERRRRKLARIRYEQALETARTRGKGLSDLAVLGVRSLVIVNGGAVIGLFTFLGNNQALAAHVFAYGVLAASIAFVLGLVTALLALLIAYRIGLEGLRADLNEVTSEVMRVHELPDPAPTPYARPAPPSGAWAIVSLACFVIGAVMALVSVSL